MHDPGKARGGGVATVSVGIVLCARRMRGLAVLLLSGGARGSTRWSLPAAPLRPDEAPERTAARLATSTLGTSPAWLQHVAVLAGSPRWKGDASLAVAYAGATSLAEAADGSRWWPVEALPPLAARDRKLVAAAVDAMRRRPDREDIAFALAGPSFTLSDLQQAHEVLIGRRLHKASFRRTLAAGRMVEPTGESRARLPGRPPRLFRRAPSTGM